MAVAPHAPFVSADEYIDSNYRPDLEYTDGVLVEHGMPTILHSILQMILVQHFGKFQKALRFLPLPEVRSLIVERARYRIPDVMLCPLPIPDGKVVTSVPWAIIEILSPDDRLSDQLARFRDYKQIGVVQVVLLDPEERTAFRCDDNGSLLVTQFTSLDLPSGSLPFDTVALFQQLVDECNEGRS